MKTSDIIGVSVIKNIKPGLDYCEILTGGFESIKCFYDSKELQAMIGKTILFDTMPDIYEGVQITRIANIAVKNVITTVDKIDNISLIPLSMDSRGVCNCSISDIKSGDTMRAAIVYMSSFILDGASGSGAKWYQIKVVDINSKIFEIRMFIDSVAQDTAQTDYLTACCGCYVQMDISNTKYGYQTTNKTFEVHSEEVALAPQVALAVELLPKWVEDDPLLVDYMEQFHYIETLSQTMDVEPGFHLVRVACELSIAQALTNVTDTFSYQLIRRAIITSRGYLINKKSDLSKIVLNSNKILRSKLSKDVELINTIDVMSESTTTTKRLYVSIRKIVNQLMDERRGLVDEKKVMLDIERISDSFGGLL